MDQIRSIASLGEETREHMLSANLGMRNQHGNMESLIKKSDKLSKDVDRADGLVN